MLSCDVCLNKFSEKASFKTIIYKNEEFRVCSDCFEDETVQMLIAQLSAERLCTLLEKVNPDYTPPFVKITKGGLKATYSKLIHDNVWGEQWKRKIR